MTINRLLIVLLLSTAFAFEAQAYNPWRPMEGGTAPAPGERRIVPDVYQLFAVDDAGLRSALDGLSDRPEDRQIIALPVPDGSVRNFIVWKNGTMAGGLQDKYTAIRTFSGTASDDPRISAKIDFTVKGFHAMIFDGEQTSFLDPFSDGRSDYYIAYYRRDYKRHSDLLKCLTDGSGIDPMGNLPTDPEAAAARTINGSRLRTYRLALACTGEYAVAVGGVALTKVSVLSAMITSVNRINGVYERELAISMQLIANEDTLIFLDAATDPYTNSSGGTMLGENQGTVTTRIGSANFDIGHVFSTGGGGIATRGCICRTSVKAQGVTGLPNPVGDAFDIDFVAHEIGHQFGSNHTFNNNADGSCNGNAVASTAFEPAGGTTIMAYAGLCSPDNIQSQSNAYFHAKSLIDILAVVNNATVAACPAITLSGNQSVSLPAFTASYTIPYKTPFELTAPAAVDSVANDGVTYCWEQYNLGDFGARLVNTHFSGPIFRSFTPDTNRTRIFPTLTRLLVNSIAYAGERLPDTARYLTFRLTTRAILNGIGTINMPDDTIHLDVINTGTPFAVLSPSAAGTTWMGTTVQTVTWNVSNTDAAPISCAAVDILLSIDGGNTFPYVLASGVPNVGSATIFVPNVVTTRARIKVKGAGNVFFDISNTNFSITQGTGTGIAGLGQDLGIKIFPIPATNELFINSAASGKLQVSLYNVPGQIVWQGSFNSTGSIPVAMLGRGMYYLHIRDEATGAVVVRKVTLE